MAAGASLVLGSFSFASGLLGNLISLTILKSKGPHHRFITRLVALFLPLVLFAITVVTVN